MLAGLIVQKVTGASARRGRHRPDHRAPAPARHLRPGRGEQTIRGAHPLGYHAEPAGSALFEHTDIDPAWAWGAGDIVSTPGDLTTFFRALLGGGRLLQPAELAQMKTTVPMALPGIRRAGGTAWACSPRRSAAAGWPGATAGSSPATRRTAA